MRLIRLGLSAFAVMSGLGLAHAAFDEGATRETYRSDRFGYSLLFPAKVLEQRYETPDGRGVELSSNDGLVKLKVLAADETLCS